MQVATSGKFVNLTVFLYANDPIYPTLQVATFTKTLLFCGSALLVLSCRKFFIRRCRFQRLISCRKRVKTSGWSFTKFVDFLTVGVDDNAIVRWFVRKSGSNLERFRYTRAPEETPSDLETAQRVA